MGSGGSSTLSSPTEVYFGHAHRTLLTKSGVLHTTRLKYAYRDRVDAESNIKYRAFWRISQSDN